MTSVDEHAVVSVQTHRLPPLTLACATDDCTLSASLLGAVTDETIFTVEAGARVDQVFIDTPQALWEPLKGLGVPERVRVRGEQDVALLISYRAWLDAEGFTGEFSHCPDAEHESSCVEVTAE